MALKNTHPSSFRDPSGHVFLEKNIVKRVIKPSYFKQYTALKTSSFFDKLFDNNLLIKHKELSSSSNEIIIQPEQIPFITYPYEWSFNQYKEAALLTLKIQKFSLENGFSLKDASVFNVAFHNGNAIFIDTLSFDFYIKNTPWRAYKQFITHFLGPLLLAHYHGAQSLKLVSEFFDGIPLKFLASILPFKSKLNPFLYSNVHLLAKFEKKHNEGFNGKIKASKLSKKGQLDIIKSLYNFIKNLKLKEDSEWGDYYNKTNYSNDAFIKKSDIINKWISNLNVETLIDVGGNDGTFVRKINTKLKQALVCDIDNNSVDVNYKTLKSENETYILPFVLDVLNPSAAIGFQNTERDSFINRIKKYAPDVTLALALIHHMSLSGNITFDMSASFFASFSKYLIIEFPRRDDSWVQHLLNNKADFKNHFGFYTLENFEFAYAEYFEVLEKKSINGSKRVMYFLKTKDVK